MDFMASASKEQSFSKSTQAIVAAVLIAGLMTLLLTRPAATAVSLTPLSGLMSLKAISAEAVPYEVAIANPKPTLIEFYADWCTTCQAMSPTMEALHQQYSERINFVMLDVDQPQWATQIADYGASGVPQFTLLDPEQQAVKTWVGKVPKSVFKNGFEQILG